MITTYTTDIIQSGVQCMAVSLIADNIEYPKGLPIFLSKASFTLSSWTIFVCIFIPSLNNIPQSQSNA